MKTLHALEQRIHALLPPRRGCRVVESKRSPAVRVEALERLGTLARRRVQHGLSAHGTPRRAFDEAVAELHENIAVLEEHVSGSERPPFAYITWAWRVFRSLRDYHDETFAARTDAAVASPANARGKPTAPPWREPDLGRSFQEVATLLRPIARSGGRAPPIDALLELAASETAFLQRRRRLFEAARRAVLDEQASGTASDADLQARLLYISDQIRGLNRLQAAGVDPNVDLLQQLKWATARRDAATLDPCIAAWQQFARAGGFPAAVRQLVTRLPEHRDAAGPLLSQQTSVTEEFPAGVLEAVRRGLQRARSAWEQSGVVRGSLAEQLAARAFGSGALPSLFSAAAQVDGLCELGRSVAPVRSAEEQARLRPVPYPTQTMVLRPAESVSDLARSIIADPRHLLIDFASGRLLARTYLQGPRPVPTSFERVREARYYVLDGSDSMLGRRGLLRDGLLLAELSNLIEYLAGAGAASVRPVVYYRYFAKVSEPPRRVATREEALAAIEDALSRVRKGSTEIEAAVLESLEQIRVERTHDEALKRAQLVLVTDGIAEIDLQKIWDARRRLGAIPVGISVLALGSENDALKRLAAAQRRAGQEIFYHFIPDRSIRALLDRFDGAPAAARQRQPPPAAQRSERGTPAAGEGPHPTGSPDAAPSGATNAASGAPADGDVAPHGSPNAPAAATESPANMEADVWEDLAQLVEELLALQSDSDVEKLEGSKLFVESLRDVGLCLERDFSEAQRARHESLRRDERMLNRRFSRWFPLLADGTSTEQTAHARSPESPSEPLAGRSEALSTIEALLAAVTEIVYLIDGPPLQRRYDAIEVMERLLLEASVPPWMYADLLEAPSAAMRAGVAAVRAAVLARDQRRAPS